MAHHLSLSQITLLFAGAVFIGGFLILMVYLLHKTFKEQRQPGNFSPQSPRVADEAAFAAAAMQGVIAKMKEQEKELIELRQAAERRARESARLSENVLREMPNGLMVFNRGGFITTANPAVRKLLGVDTWARRRYPEILGPDSALAQRIQACLESNGAVAQETVHYQTGSGETRVLGVSLSPLHAPNGDAEGAICLLTDLTEVYQLEEKVRVKDHLAALGAMSAGIAHELKNSLATISGYAQLLRDAGLSAENRDFAQKIVAEIRALSQVVTDFLNLSKPVNLAARPVDMENLLCQLVAEFERAHSPFGPAISMSGQFAVVEGDGVLLRQAFSNLLRNSCEALAGGTDAGAIQISGEIVREAGRDQLRIRISDTGHGIPTEDKEKVFLPFFTTKPEGSGLGLALVQKILVSHNGTVSLENSAPGGACFAVCLPVLRADSQPPAS